MYVGPKTFLLNHSPGKNIDCIILYHPAFSQWTCLTGVLRCTIFWNGLGIQVFLSFASSSSVRALCYAL